MINNYSSVVNNGLSYNANLYKAYEVAHSSLVSAFSSFFWGAQEEDVEDISLPTIEEQYGNKYAGVVKVSEKITGILQENPIDGIEVPFPKGLSHAVVEEYLHKKDPQIFIKWKELSGLYAAHCNPYKDYPFPMSLIGYFAKKPDGASFLQREDISSALQEIQTRIEQAFTQLSTEDIAFLSQGGLDIWLQEIASKNSYIMARSSSVEDLKNLANAGGNLSEAYVMPSMEEVLASAGRVIASYFGAPSLKNRILADNNPFVTPLLLPVMFQELIGEEIGGAKNAEDIPVSMVLFTSEPVDSEGGFRVTKISCSFGHGEGVVGAGGIECDTVHIVESLNNPGQFFSAYQNAEKPRRLAPMRDPVTGKIELQPVDNPPQLVHKRALSEAMIAKLAIFAKELEKAYDGNPMDVEIVIKKGIIHIVQARRVNRPAVTPSFLNMDTVSLYEQQRILPRQKSFVAKTLVQGKGCCVVARPDEILRCDSLKQAEDLFDKQKHRCVIVKLDEPANSHPVVNFSSLGIPCLFVPSFEQPCSDWSLSDWDYTMVVCPQSGRILRWALPALDPKLCIEEGYAFHPAALGVSLFEEHPKDSLSPGRSRKPSKEVSDLLKALEEERVSSAALSILHTLQQTTATEMGHVQHAYADLGQTSPPFVEKLQVKLEEVWKELEVVYTKPVPRLQKLFLLKSLRLLLTGQNSGALSTYSYLDVEHLVHHKVREGIYRQRAGKAHPDFAELLSFNDYAISEGVQETWINFLLSLEKLDATDALKAQKNSLEKMVALLRSFSASEQFMSAFFHFVCIPAIKKGGDLSAIFDAISSITPEEESLFQMLQTKEKALASCRARLSLFEDPATYSLAQEELFQLHAFFSDPKLFIDPVKEGSSLVKILAAETLKELVEVSDLAVKTMKKSPHFSVEEKLEHKDALLHSNFHVLSSWFKELISNKLLDYSVDRYLADIERAWSYLNMDEEDLFPSKNFSVGAAVINSRALFGRHTPRTLEDMFTLIHQNQIIAVSLLALSEKPLSVLPDFIGSAHDGVLLLISDASLCGVDVVADKVKLQYNIPLQNHSAGLEIEYDKEKDCFFFRGKLFGEQRGRWTACAEYIQALDAAGGMSLEGPVDLTEQQLLFTWKVEKKSIRFAVDQFKQFLDYSFDGWDKEGIFRKMKDYMDVKMPILVAGMGKWFHEHNITEAHAFTDPYLGWYRIFRIV